MTTSKAPEGVAKEWPRWSPWAAVGFLLLVLCLVWFLLPLRDWSEASQSWLLGLGLCGVLIFITTHIAFLPAPDWPLPLAAGYVYGFWVFPLIYFSIVLATCSPFFAARYLVRDKIRALVGLGHPGDRRPRGGRGSQDQDQA